MTIHFNARQLPDKVLEGLKSTDIFKIPIQLRIKDAK